MQKVALGIGAALLLIVVGVFVWWQFGNLAAVIQQNFLQGEAIPSSFAPPRAGTFVSLVGPTLTIEERGVAQTFMVAPEAQATSRTEAGKTGRYLADITPGADLFLSQSTNGSGAITGAFVIEPYDEPSRTEEVLTGVITQNSDGSFVLVGSKGERTEVLAESATTYSIVTSGVIAPNYSDAVDGRSVRVVGTFTGNTLIARVIDLL